MLPKSVTPTRVASNYTGSIAALEKLDASDIETLDGLAAGGKQKRSACHLVCLQVLILSLLFVIGSLHLPGASLPINLERLRVFTNEIFGSAVDLGFENWPKLP